MGGRAAIGAARELEAKVARGVRDELRRHVGLASGRASCTARSDRSTHTRARGSRHRQPSGNPGSEHPCPAPSPCRQAGAGNPHCQWNQGSAAALTMRRCPVTLEEASPASAPARTATASADHWSWPTAAIAAAPRTPDPGSRSQGRRTTTRPSHQRTVFPARPRPERSRQGGHRDAHPTRERASSLNAPSGRRPAPQAERDHRCRRKARPQPRILLTTAAAAGILWGSKTA